MSWATRFNNLGRFSPFTRSPPQGGSQVSDADFSYITAEDLRKHTAGDGGHSQHRQPQRAESPVEYGPPRDTDCLMLRNKKRDFTVHFPAYSIAKGELTVGQVREHAAKKMGVVDVRRVKLLYKGKNLRDDSRTCKQEGLRHEVELLCTIADSMPSADGSEDDDDDDDGIAEDGMGEQMGADGEAKRRRNRGKRTKRRNKREQTSGTSTPMEYAANSSNLSPPQHAAPASSQHSRAPSPKPPGTPLTAMDKLNALRDKFRSDYLPQAQAFIEHPPADRAKRDFDHKRLSETILAQILLKLDAVETEGDGEARATRKEVVRQTQAVLTEMDELMKR
ncbi:hypothetical protein B0A55_05286 [Friedmanniomyces simplex]|uniref:BAG domain-containing protein n=1 Tax=Friedmanniomyces simplex TaxID=329884 RepID=A0A4U0X958_9PEZI|nr:hypothetical protein B0A55_05286 [Friedmanniomyces simplex]